MSSNHYFMIKLIFYRSFSILNPFPAENKITISVFVLKSKIQKLNSHNIFVTVLEVTK